MFFDVTAKKGSIYIRLKSFLKLKQPCIEKHRPSTKCPPHPMFKALWKRSQMDPDPNCSQSLVSPSVWPKLLLDKLIYARIFILESLVTRARVFAAQLTVCSTQFIYIVVLNRIRSRFLGHFRPAPTRF